MVKTETISISNQGDQFSGYLAKPTQNIRGGILVVQEIFGVNSHIRDVTERIAKEGYIALAYDAFWRTDPGIVLEYDEEGAKKGREIREKVSLDQATADMKACLEAMKVFPELDGKKLGVIGFCMGGQYGYLAATRIHPAAISSFYGGGIADILNEAGNIRTPIQFHFGEKDTAIPMSDVEKIKEALQNNSNAEIFVYPEADHGFHCDKRSSYHSESAKKAWRRSMDLFAKYIG